MFENKLLFSRENVNEVTSYNSSPPNTWLKLDEDKFNKINIYFKKFVYTIEGKYSLNLLNKGENVYLDIKEINLTLNIINIFFTFLGLSIFYFFGAFYSIIIFIIVFFLYLRFKVYLVN